MPFLSPVSQQHRIAGKYKKLIFFNLLNFRHNLNYAPEAEIAQTYHLLLDNGVPADNIILFMDGGYTNHPDIPFKDALYTDKNLSRNYNEGLKVDWRKRQSQGWVGTRFGNVSQYLDFFIILNF